MKAVGKNNKTRPAYIRGHAGPQQAHQCGRRQGGQREEGQRRPLHGELPPPLQEMLGDTSGPIGVVLSENGNHRLSDMTDLLLLSDLLDTIVEEEGEMEEY